MPLMMAPESGVTVRMYRPGHGDCFLLAFPTDTGGTFRVLIDFGYKPGSKVHATVAEVATDIVEATGGKLDLVIVTHEHQDHLNGFLSDAFDELKVGEAWFAWTEDPSDSVANALRARHRDQLIGLLSAYEQLGVDGGDAPRTWLKALIELELGDEPEASGVSLGFAATDPARSGNKRAMAMLKEKAKRERGIRFVAPHGDILNMEGVSGVRVFPLGPPRDPDLIADEDPVGTESFPGQAMTAPSKHSFLAAVRAAQSDGNGISDGPFDPVYGVPIDRAMDHPDFGSFFSKHYGGGSAIDVPDSEREVPDDAPFRRIPTDWLQSAEDLALKLNTGINNTSLVLAFELKASRKVLLFVGDAQRGNWISWTDGEWPEDKGAITAKDLLARTVLYKVGHHGSHNATLDGTAKSAYPNLSWMAQGRYRREFTAMITAVPAWAYKQVPVWAHPLAAIKTALVDKTSGRVFQTDTDAPEKPESVSGEEWSEFMARVRCTLLYFECDFADSDV
ncbi:hypothetical protein EAH89_18825 [Roseomonas nepalensis]|uniref:Uncharacterized protein n=1 Tax=Muricoccus nepalensis TaxID=1854500 RepID=A0A502FTI5_9PROT|nr:hypothetical protein [Roseomonas nepalensis]TPG52293.1 hypothetical protein EAH89_18825 [Roseomonas nepalensis]